MKNIEIKKFLDYFEKLDNNSKKQIKTAFELLIPSEKYNYDLRANIYSCIQTYNKNNNTQKKLCHIISDIHKKDNLGNDWISSYNLIKKALNNNCTKNPIFENLATFFEIDPTNFQTNMANLNDQDLIKKMYQILNPKNKVIIDFLMSKALQNKPLDDFIELIEILTKK